MKTEELLKINRSLVRRTREVPSTRCNLHAATHEPRFFSAAPRNEAPDLDGLVFASGKNKGRVSGVLLVCGNDFASAISEGHLAAAVEGACPTALLGKSYRSR